MPLCKEGHFLHRNRSGKRRFYELFSITYGMLFLFIWSAIADHAVLYNHVVDWDNAKILGKECNASIRWIRESMWIRRRGPQAMNRDEGANFLSHVFDPFLTSSTPSTVSVRPTGKKKDRSTSFWRWVSSRIPEIVNREFNFWFCFDELSFYS